MKVFIGGSRKISKINQQIKNRIENIINKNFIVLVGDANGVDKSIQSYLFSKNYKNVFIFCVNKQCRNNIGSWRIRQIKYDSKIKDYKYYSSKDIIMAKEADFGFMIWDGESKGTLNNIVRLLKQNKSVLVYFSPKKNFYDLNNFSDLDSVFPKCNDLWFGIVPNLFSESL